MPSGAPLARSSEVRISKPCIGAQLNARSTSRSSVPLRIDGWLILESLWRVYKEAGRTDRSTQVGELLTGPFVHHALSHDEDDPADGGDVGDRIALDRNDVGFVAGLELAELVAHADRVGRQRVRRDERGHRALPAVLDAPNEFLGISAMRAGGRVSRKDDLGS